MVRKREEDAQNFQELFRAVEYVADVIGVVVVTSGINTTGTGTGTGSRGVSEGGEAHGPRSRLELPQQSMQPHV